MTETSPNPNKIEIVVESNETGKRLDIYLSISFPAYSRSFIKKIIESNQVFVNNEVEYRANYTPKKDDKITFYVNENDLSSKTKLTPEKLPLDIIYEDSDLLAVNKPYGMVVHPADGNWSGTLMNAVMFHYKEEMTSINNNIRAGLIHRLDKETSGLVLIGKTNLGLFHFTKLFSERKVQKYYLLLAEGNEDIINRLREQEVVENFLGRNPQNRKKVKSYKIGTIDNNSASVRIAKTFFYKIASKGRYVFMLAKPETGRTHQIRVHVNDLGLKIVGDQIYGSQKEQEDRMMLHAYVLEILNIDQNELVLKAPLQKDYLDILEKYDLSFKEFENQVSNLINLKT